jgi:hypothetical protein
MNANPPTGLALDRAVAAQLSYHARMSAVFAVGGDIAESGSEAVLAWAILATSWPGAEPSARECANELIGEEQAGVSPEAQAAAQTRAHSLALELEAHFVSTGQHDVAALYATVAEHLGSTISALVPSG